MSISPSEQSSRGRSPPTHGGFPRYGEYPQQGGFPMHGGYPTQGGFPMHGGFPGHEESLPQGGFPTYGGPPLYGGYPTMDPTDFSYPGWSDPRAFNTGPSSHRNRRGPSPAPDSDHGSGNPRMAPTQTSYIPSRNGYKCIIAVMCGKTFPSEQAVQAHVE